ncbi:hypothetical protein [Helicobacter rodentium]|uniref:hypothetical protein n=1 Tax=Helicobacter rodentium TaxID=59617 RepID=UPI0025A5B53D|nr:hypothetical protein [Helicobacter rodentium]
MLDYGLLRHFIPRNDAVIASWFARLWIASLEFVRTQWCFRMQNLDYLRFYECRITPAIIEPNKATI